MENEYTNQEQQDQEPQISDDILLNEISIDTAEKDVNRKVEYNLNPSDFQQDRPQGQPVEKRVFNPDFTTEMVVDGIDTLQATVFSVLNINKYKGRYFKDEKERREAEDYGYLTDQEIDNLPFEKKILAERFKKYREKCEKVNSTIDFNDEEREQLRRPLKEMVKKHGFDIPPGLALVLSLGNIMTPRIIDLLSD